MSQQDLVPLKEQFSAASSRWPNLQAHLITWPVDQPEPEDLSGIGLGGHDCLPSPAPPGEMHFTAVLTGGMDLDTPDYRYRAGKAGALLLRWDFARFGGDPREVEDPDELIGLEQRFQVLARNGAQILGESGGDVGVSNWVLMWTGRTRWLLAVFEVLRPGQREIGCYAVETIEDVFLGSAQAIGRWVPEGGEEIPAEALKTDLSAMMAPADLARIFDVKQDALEKRLARWRNKNRGSPDYTEVLHRKPREPQYLYRVSAARPLIDDMKSD